MALSFSKQIGFPPVTRIVLETRDVVHHNSMLYFLASLYVSILYHTWIKANQLTRLLSLLCVTGCYINANFFSLFNRVTVAEGGEFLMQESLF